MRESTRLATSIAQDSKPTTESGKRLRSGFLSGSQHRLAIALLRQRDYAGAEAAARKAVEFRRQREDAGVFERGESQEVTMVHAVALARLGRMEEARRVIAPALAFFARLAAAPDEAYYNLWMAIAKYAHAVTAPEEAQPLLAQAQAHLDRLPKAMNRLKSMQRLRDDVTREQKAKP